MEDIKKKLEIVFTLARVQEVSNNPQDEKGLLQMIHLKKELFDLLDKVPQEKKK